MSKYGMRFVTGLVRLICVMNVNANAELGASPYRTIGRYRTMDHYTDVLH